MAAWRRAIELSLGEADTAKLRSIAQSRTEPASRVERARILLAYREDPSFFAVGRALGLLIIKRSSAASSAPWPKARWLRWMIALAPVESRRSLLRPRHGWCRWRAGRRRNLAMPANCGQRGFWPATLASMDPRRDMRASPNLAQGTVCKILDQEEVKPHKVQISLEQAQCRTFPFQKMARSAMVCRRWKI